MFYSITVTEIYMNILKHLPDIATYYSIIIIGYNYYSCRTLFS